MSNIAELKHRADLEINDYATKLKLSPDLITKLTDGEVLESDIEEARVAINGSLGTLLAARPADLTKPELDMLRMGLQLMGTVVEIRAFGESSVCPQRC
jgi:hypothetical protein